jgi:hypothetical protein
MLEGRAASDHLRIENGKGWFESADERTIRPDQWYWMLKASFTF